MPFFTFGLFMFLSSVVSATLALTLLPALLAGYGPVANRPSRVHR
jgi:hypothetical protein